MKLKMHSKILLLLGLACCLSGCASGQKHENIDQAMSAIENLEYENALLLFEKGLAEGEDEELLYRGQGIAHMGMTNYAEAIEAFEKSLSYCNGSVTDLQFDTNYYLATAYYKNGDSVHAREIYDAIIALREDEQMAYYLRGVLELEEDNFDNGGRADFEKALELAPKDYDCLFNVYRSLEKYGYQDAGAEYLRDALREGEDDMSDYDKGRLHYYLKEYDVAKNYLEKARDTGSAEAILFLGRTYEALGDYNYASSVYADFLAKHENHPQIQNQLGVCKMQMGEYEAALDAFQAGLESEDKTYQQTLRFNEIAAYERLAQFKKATVLMESYLAAYPDDARAKREYEFLKTR